MMNSPRMSSPSSSAAPPPAANAAHRTSPLRLYPKHSKPRHYRLAAAVAASTRRAGRRSQSWTPPGRRGGAGSIWVNPSAPPRPGATSRTLRRLVELDDLDAALRLLLGGPSTSTPAASDSVPEPPAVITCNILIKKLCSRRRLADAERVLETLKASGAADAVSHNTLVAGYCRDGRLSDAERVLDVARASGAANVVTYTALIDGYCRSSRLADALHLIASMPVAPDTYTYNTVLKGLCGAKQWEEAKELMEEMIGNNCHPNEVTFATQIRAFCQNGLLDRAVELLEQMPQYGCTPDVIIYSTLVNGFSEHGRVDKALELFNTMLCKPNTVCYNAALKGLCIAGRWEEVGELIAEMVRKDCPPNDATFSTLINTLCQNRVYVELSDGVMLRSL
ncbi:unnamed protein product [Urochloa decumbens]|uniref:Pentatricopeptide repeat-containing protein n=1 Tax=Urochloa decumbens TaxID=240449 RepID=A0ABC9CLD4_9POAL